MSSAAANEPKEFPWSGRLPLALGHRGAPRLAPENRRASLTAALTTLDGIETDLHRTKDGVLVVNHDPHLGHHATPETLITQNDLAHLRRLEPELLTVQDLRQLLEEHPAALANIELKSSAPDGDRRSADLAEELAGWPAEVAARVWLSCFDPLELLRLADFGVKVPLAFLVFEARALALLPSLPVAAVHPHHTLVTSEHVAAWHAAGLAVFTWTVNEEPLALKLLEDGVDGLMGDVPEVLLAARSARR